MPRTLIDVGCAWDTPQFRDLCPKAELLLVDPIREYEARMRAAVTERGGAWAMVAAGSREGTLPFKVNIDDPEKSSTYVRTPLASKAGRIEERECPVMPLDRIVELKGSTPPFGLKVDTEGHELDVIAGAHQTLRESLFVIVEVSVQQRFVGSYRFEEMIAEMDNLNFRVSNILSAEPDANGLVRSMDVLFLPSETGTAR